ncbi:hypothetical protein LCGC14_1921250 [marine sediment metagenome]|uniref:Uncharacterized protein n=1 Tax=marine sediment metagenome TaxID=412755 RepID=A0A0F9I4Q8_9ZZZZ
MLNKDKIIIDLCGGSGAWSKPYKDAGYDVWNITLPDYNVRTYKPPDYVYGILAAPVCTMFSLARTRAKIPRDFRQGMELVISCLNIIWECRYKNKLAFWSLENPMGYLRQFLGKPAFTFDPCDFGDPYTKKTDLWGYFNEPKKKPYNLTNKEKALCTVNNRKLPSIPDITGSKQADRRAITPLGFARAFYKANK